MKDNRIHHPSIRQFRTGVAAAIALAALGMGSALADDIVIGASLPLSGPFAGFGSFQQWGYKRAVDEVNKAGGITVDGKKRDGEAHHPRRQDRSERHRLEYRDAYLSRARRRRCSAPARRRSSTPARWSPSGPRMPMVTGCDPLEAFKSVRKWKWVWDIFFDEPELGGTRS